MYPVAVAPRATGTTAGRRAPPVLQRIIERDPANLKRLTRRFVAESHQNPATFWWDWWDSLSRGALRRIPSCFGGIGGILGGRGRCEWGGETVAPESRLPDGLDEPGLDKGSEIAQHRAL